MFLDSRLEETRTVQSKRNLCRRRDNKKEGREKEIKIYSYAEDSLNIFDIKTRNSRSPLNLTK